MRTSLIALILLICFSLVGKVYATPPFYHENDYQKMVIFLEQSDGTKRNGEMLNAMYNPEKPDTWTGVTWVWVGDAGDEILRIKEISMTNLPLVGNLNLSGLSILEALSFSYSHIDKVRLDGCMALNRLGCPHNEIMEVSLANCLALTICTIFDNKLTELSFSDSPNIRNIDCSNNNLVNLDLSNLQKLRELNCTDNQLVSLDLVGSTALEILNCENNLLTSLELDICKELWRISCKNNKLSKITINDFTSLRDLYCEENKLTFASLPLFYPPSYGRYEYSPQEKINVGPVSIGGNINLGEQWLINEKETIFKWYREGGGQITPTSAVKGVFSFDESFAGDVIFCLMTNDALRKLTLETELISFAGALNPPTIEAEPEDATVAIGSNVSFSVTAKAPANCQVIYQWELSEDEGGNWQEIKSATTDNYNIDNITYSQNGHLFRCRLVTQREEDYSEEKFTRGAALAVVAQPEIIDEPSSLTVANEGKACFAIGAQAEDSLEGGELIYLWQIKKEGDTNWEDALSEEPSLEITNVDYEEHNNSSIRCTIKNRKNGIYSAPVLSKEVHLGVVSEPKILSGPLDAHGALGESATFSLEVTIADESEGGQISYQWQEASKDIDDWTDIAGAQSNNHQISPITSEHHQRRYRSLVFNTKDGVKSKTITSDIGTLYLELSYGLTILQPQSGHDENNPLNINKGSLVVIEILGPLPFIESLALEIDNNGEILLPINNRVYYLLPTSLNTGEHTLVLKLVDSTGKETRRDVTFFFDNSRQGFGFGRLNFGW